MVIMLVQNNKKELRKLMNCVSAVCPRDLIVGFDDADNAISYAENRRVDMCFADAMLDNSSGIALTRELRDLNENVCVNLLADDKEFAVDAWQHHINNYLIKPVTKAEVRDSIIV